MNDAHTPFELVEPDLGRPGLHMFRVVGHFMNPLPARAGDVLIAEPDDAFLQMATYRPVGYSWSAALSTAPSGLGKDYYVAQLLRLFHDGLIVPRNRSAAEFVTTCSKPAARARAPRNTKARESVVYPPLRLVRDA